WRTLELSFKLATRFHEPPFAQGHKQNGIELRVEQCLSRRLVGKKPGRSAQYGNRLFGTGCLGEPARSPEDYKKKQSGQPQQSFLPAAMRPGVCEQITQLLTPRNTCGDCARGFAEQERNRSNNGVLNPWNSASDH